MTLPGSRPIQLSIVIVSWNTRNYLEKCLRSILNDSISSECEVWVVDNASTDNSAELVRNLFPEVRLIENSENLGFAGANNIAIPKAIGRNILFLNPDTDLGSGAIGSMERFLDAHPEAGAVGPLTLNPDDSLQTSAYPAPTLTREFWRLFHLDRLAEAGDYRMQSWDRRRPHEVDVLQGACLMLRREALDEVDLLDEDYFMYSEEVDLCYRLRKAGWSIHWLPQAKVVHHGGQSSKQVPIESFLNLYKGKITYFRKHHGTAAALAYKLLLVAASLVRLVVSPLALLQRREQRNRYLALAGRYRRLLTQMPGM